MMRIDLLGIGKKFNSEWVFRDVGFCFAEGSVTAVSGRNGSGKSTLLQVVAGNLHPTAGKVTYTLGGKDIPVDEIYRHLCIVAPYVELIEDFTLPEMLKFHFSFKSFLPGINIHSIIEILGLTDMREKPIRQFSSGIRQRIRLAIAFFSDVPLLLLDEPVMNLDKPGIEWYHNLIRDYSLNRTLVICSNQCETEASFAASVLNIEDFKPADRSFHAGIGL